jgi:osmotically-inducible protein OsmY
MKSDSELQHEIEQLPEIVDENIDVRVTAGVVTLTGSVRSNANRWDTDDAVRRVEGVKDLSDKTMVLAEQTREPEGDIAKPWFP